MHMSHSPRWIALAIACIGLPACQSSRNVVTGVVAPAQPDALSSAADVLPDYVLGPQDSISVRVFREPDLSLDNVTVDSGGRFDMALIGKVVATGKTPDELSDEIRQRYDQYLVKPMVSVNVLTVNSKRLTVEGAVGSPGVFPLASNSDLLSAVALAGGPTDIAKMSEVAVFRKINGQDMVAAYDLARIRSGELANPQILPGDIVVVGFSGLKQGARQILLTVPLISIFRPFN